MVYRLGDELCTEIPWKHVDELDIERRRRNYGESTKVDSHRDSESTMLSSLECFLDSCLIDQSVTSPLGGAH